MVRLPDDWNGRLVVSGAPGTRTQYAGDFLFSDWLLARGYAYAMTDKGNNGSSFYKDGDQPGDAIAEWNHRVTQLTRATKQVVAQRYGRAPRRTYLVRHLQRRLPRALAAGEPARALRRRRRLGGHALPGAARPTC